MTAGGGPRADGPASARVVPITVAAWLGAALLAGASGAMAGLRPPRPQMLLAAVTVLALALIRAVAPFRAFAAAVDLRALVLFHLTRFVGLYFLLLYGRGELPWAFAVPGGFGDIVVAAAALLLAAHKYLLLAHSPAHYRALGRLVADRKATPRARWLDAYAEGVMTALRTIATPKKHVNVLQHLLGFLKDRLDAGDKRELLGVIDDYARGLVPLIVPITLVNHHVARLDVAYVRDQVYLRPYPKELMLRNHV